MSAAVWKTLGIGKTDDKAAIRRAYAARLKALDVDNDVAGFAKLRQARDTALRMAAGAARAQEPQHGAPDIGGDLAGDDGADLGIAADDWLIDAPSPTDPVEASLPDPVAAERAAAERRVPDLLNALAALLFPNGDYSDEGFTLADFEAAQAHVADLITEARTARLEVTHAIDHHLAEMMAQGWPRSAALVNAPAEEFHWLDEAGSLDERPALRFLNDRIKGMRFAEKVQASDHPLNKAWAELTREGDKVTWAHRRAVNSADVANLLTGIRQRFPEVESYLNAERVAVWERRFSINGPGRVGSVIQYGGLLYAGFLLISFFFSPADGDGGASPGQQRNEAFQIALEQLFDPPDGQVTVEQRSPELSTILFNAYVSTTDEDEALERMRSAARYWVVTESATRPALDFDEQMAILRVKRDWLLALRDQQLMTDHCPLAAPSSPWAMADLNLSNEAANRETALLRMLVDQEMIDNREAQPAAPPQRASVPGELVGLALESSGLSRADFDAALAGTAVRNLCTVKLALIEAALERPAGVSADLLRML